MRNQRRIAALAARSVGSRKGLALSVVLGLAAVPAVVFAPMASATPPPTCIVSINGGPAANYGTLQIAVGGASPGSTLRLHSDCTGDTTISEDLTITGGPSGATLHGGGVTEDGSVITISDANVTLANLDVSGGTGGPDPHNAPGTFGGGILNQGSLTLTNVSVTHNSADYGGGIFNDNGSTLAFGGTSGTSVNNNTATWDGGGIFNFGTLSTSTNATVNNNHVTSIGGVFVGGPGLGGGIVNADLGTATLRNISVNGNTAPGNGGGIWNGYSGTVNLINATVNGNTTTTGNGGGIANDAVLGTATLTISDTSIKNNHAPAGTGGGIYNTGSATLSRSVTVTSNSATDGGIFNTGTLVAPAGDVFGNTPDNIS